MLGMLIFLGLMLLPGLLLVKLSGLHRGKSLSEILGIGFGLSIGVTILILLATTTVSGSVKSIHLWGVLIGSALGIAMLSIKSILHPRNSLIQASMKDLLIIAIAAAHFSTLSSQFFEYPIFPRLLSGDFSAHLTGALAFMNGTELPTQTNYPPGVRLIIASGLIFLGGEPFISMQQTMVIIASLTPTLVYATANKLFRNQMLGVAAAAVYAFTGSIWYFGLFMSGLYANFLGDLLSFMLLYLVVEFTYQKRSSLYFILPFAALASYVTHYTVALLVFSLSIFTVFIWRVEKPKLKSYSMALFLTLVPVIPVIAARFDLFRNFLTFPTASAGVFAYEPALYKEILNSFSPFLLYLSIQINSIWTPAFILIAGIGAVVVQLYKYLGRNSDHSRGNLEVTSLHDDKGYLWIFALVWFFSVWFFSPTRPMAWRFAYYSLLPLTFLLAFLAYHVVINSSSMLGWLTAKIYAATRLREVSQSRKRKDLEKLNLRFQSGRIRRVSPIIFLVIVGFVYIDPMLYPFHESSPFYFLIDDVFLESTTQDHHNEQLAIYQAIQWIKENTPKNAKFLAVTDDRFTFMDVIADRRSPLIGKNLPPSLAYNVTRQFNIDYTVVTKGLRPSLISPTRLVDLLANYRASRNFEEVYSNQIVSIFKLK